MNSNRKTLVSLIVAAVLLPAAGAQAVVRYVALDGSGADGLSWATAYKTIQAAINDTLMVGGGEIHVKQGVYKLTSTVAVKKAVRIYGGYSGVGETRDWTTYQTTLDGQGKTYRCVDVTGNATIDGFAIMQGSGASEEPDAAGIAIVDRTATITHCLLKYNRVPGFGGAIAMSNADGTKIANCTFVQNTAAGCGGAIYNEGGKGVQITDCTFLENSANDSGGAIYNVESSVTITGCIFRSNTVGSDTSCVGGAVFNDKSSPTITNCLFEANRAPYGAGMFNYLGSPVIDSCSFIACDPLFATDGGGIYNNGGSPTVKNCLFQQNDVGNQGAGLMSDGAAGKTINCVFWQNHADRGGGAIYITSSSTVNPQFTNCTLFDNSTGGMGGGVYSEGTPSTFVNCIIWRNVADGGTPGVYTLPGTSTPPVARYCDIEGSSTYPGTKNLRVDPLCVDPNSGDFSLTIDSPCLDAGDNSVVAGVAKDYNDEPRLVDGDGNGSALVDIGACEFQAGSDHVTRGEILQGVAYDSPSDTSPTYVFTLRLETDDTLTSVSFRAPAESPTFTIPADMHTSTGDVETYHLAQGKAHVWEYRATAATPSALAVYCDGIYRIFAHYRNGLQDEVQVAYTTPETGGAIPQPTQKPQVSAPVQGAAVGSPLTFRWGACTDDFVNAIYLTIADSTTNLDVAGDLLAKTATASDPYALGAGSYDAEIGFANLYDDVVSSDGTPFRCGKAVMVGLHFIVPYTAVYRFWAPATDRHFYTASEGEKDKLINNYSDTWTFEGVGFNACSTQSNSRLLPVYRFWSGQTHFYTINEAEKNKLISKYSKVWKPEGIAFYAYPEGAEPPECVPVYRFWKASDDTHFFTANEAEATKIRTKYTKVYTYEGVAFYAFPR